MPHQMMPLRMCCLSMFLFCTCTIVLVEIRCASCTRSSGVSSPSSWRKTALQQDLIASEEKRPGVSQQLELQMANNRLKQNESAVLQELESKLIGAENDIPETDMREQKLADEAARLHKELNAEHELQRRAG